MPDTICSVAEAGSSNVSDAPVMTEQGRVLRKLFDAAVRAAHPAEILRRYLPPPPRGRIFILATGKSAAIMSAVAEEYYLVNAGLDPARLCGVATTRHGHKVPTRIIEVIEAGHPIPDEGSIRGAEKALALADEAGDEDLILALISGGGSATWVAPADSVTLAQKQQLNRSLLRSGVPISEINVVRKHLSRIKGGRLTKRAYPAKVVTLAISDVPHDDPAMIASGPTVADASTLQQAREIIERYRLEIGDELRSALREPSNESIKPDDLVFKDPHFDIIARPSDAVGAVATAAQQAGYEVIDLGANVEGEARSVAMTHARLAVDAKAHGRRVAIISGGELTVVLRGNGRGGPNQEYALALMAALQEVKGVAILAADTDGSDGGAGLPTDPAGALVDSLTFAAMRKLNLDPISYLDRNDSTSFFEQLGALLLTGPTLTNVNDIRVVLVD